MSASLLWFHDHGLGATRLNVFAGLAAAYILRDEFDTGLEPNPIGIPGGIDPTPFATGPMIPPAPEERGLKDTVKANPGYFTTIRAKFELPMGVTAPQDYVYHCHIVEHEDNDMMRPFWTSQDLVDSAAPHSCRFELLRTHSAQMAVASCWIVERFNVVSDVSERKFPVLVDSFLDALLL
jgi:hypothetical protein